MFRVFLLVIGFIGALNEVSATCGYESCNALKSGAINVHLVPHTHLDPGWLKTVDQYYWGSRRDIGEDGDTGAVNLILDGVIDELTKDPKRKFIFVEQAFFTRWWNELHDMQRHTVRRLVWDGQLEFVGGGWVMNDEATCHYSDMIENMQHGFRVLNDSFGECARPRAAWQIDPFGHSKTQAELFALMGFDGLMFARADYQDLDKRNDEKKLGMVWKANKDLGNAATLFTQVFSSGFYGPPAGFCFDTFCEQDPIMDDPRMEQYNLDKKVGEFIEIVRKEANSSATDNLIMTMGMDFNYVNARAWFKNLDKLIRYVNEKQENGSNINLIYSTTSCYIEAQNQSPQKWSSKVDDFMPYANDPHAYWTGFYTSRPSQKRFYRMASSFYQSCKQLDTLARLGPLDQHDLGVMRDAVLLVQHHDAMTGTAKQHVAYDYARRISNGFKECEETISDALDQIIDVNSSVAQKTQFQFCQLLNVSSCAASQSSRQFAVVIFNSLARDRVDYARIPVNSKNYLVTGPDGKQLDAQLVQLGESQQLKEQNSAPYELVFPVEIPALGVSVYFVKAVAHQVELEESSNNAGFIENEHIRLSFDPQTGELQTYLDKTSSSEVSLDAKFAYYLPAVGNNEVFQNRSSGAYIFRPNCSAQNQPDLCAQGAAENSVFQVSGKTGDHVQELRYSSDWLSKVIRLYNDSKEVELEWTVGPIPVDEEQKIGKEVIVRFESNLNSNSSWYTDANGRQIIERIRNFRETYDLNLTEPIAANYFPITNLAAIADVGRGLMLNVFTDRAQGAGSLKDGQLEIMVHRRLLHDDAFGVNEALNETGADGRGLVVRGKLRFSINSINESLIIQRRRMQELYWNPLVTFSQNHTYQHWAKELGFPTKFSGLSRNLPEQVHLLSLEQWRGNTILLRLEHLYPLDSRNPLAIPALVKLDSLFNTMKVLSITELTLGANLNLSDLKRFQWRTAERENIFPWDWQQREARSFTESPVFGNLSVVIRPSEIRTFQVVVDDKPKL